MLIVIMGANVEFRTAPDNGQMFNLGEFLCSLTASIWEVGWYISAVLL